MSRVVLTYTAHFCTLISIV